ncbi:glycosyltransferase family A protein [Flavobacterium sp. MC2016-06]|jgi:glycosyltransferase involved in cell wall biosynthesis|uniref:glycosyltransferase family 2 protein n=1 Tax=Flavobacterium sp. MC2016-06 TaxID=2676308 RepID=UPI0012BAE4BB|nr:glycosyltransferase family A protein [Flavobacterium sp. MC2016-06]MBU3858664.1 glycosyltransferase family 2 protein [Flavobacterium sp. MC2016-06]
MNPLISIIIPTYNRGYLIWETLDSILNQTYTHWECIVVDDGSTDNTEKILLSYIEKDNRFKYYKRPDNYKKGANACRNYGFEVSKGEFIKWFDSDDIMCDFCLAEEIKKINFNTELVISSLMLFDFDKKIPLKQSKIFSDNLIYDYFTGKIVLYVSGPLWRRDFLNKQAYLFDEKISNVDDWDFNMRMLYELPIIEFNKQASILYRIHEMSLSQEIKKGNIVEITSILNALEKHLKLIKLNKITAYKPLIKYTLSYYKNRIYLSLQSHENYSFQLYKRMIKIHFLEIYDFKGLLKTTIGYVSYKMFNKGHIFFK